MIGALLLIFIGIPVIGMAGISTFSPPRTAVAASAKCGGLGASIWPVSGPTTSPFGTRLAPDEDADHAKTEFHSGIDIAADSGTPVKAAAGGVVTFAGSNGNYGLMVQLHHVDDTETWYGHLSQIVAPEGTVVALGSTIGRVGSTGRSTGPHLHFEYRDANGKAVDPHRLCVDARTATGGALTPAQFVTKLRPYGIAAADALGVDKSYADFFVTHWAQESGFESPEWIGRNGADYNYAGIKGSGPWRRYDSIEAFVVDYLDVLQTTRVSSGLAYAEVIQKMKNGAPLNDVFAAMGRSPWDQDHYGRNLGLLDGTLLQRRHSELAPWL